MTKTNLDWTHKQMGLVDIRKVKKLYVLKIAAIDSPLFVDERIFEERLKSYFLKDISKISRDDIRNVEWNMYITKGYYVKINMLGELEKYNHDPEKWYVSYLEIAGPLGTFCSIYNNNDKE